MNAKKELAEIDAQMGLINDRLTQIEDLPEPEGDEVARSETVQKLKDESDELIGRWKELNKTREPVLQRAQQLEDIAAAAKDLTRVEGGDGARWMGGGPAFHKKTDPFEGNLLRLDNTEVINRSRSFIENEKRVWISDANRERLDGFVQRSVSDDEEDAASFDGTYIARRALLTENGPYRRAFRKYIAGRDAWSLTDEERAAVNAYQTFERNEVRRAAGENVGSAGGFGVPIIIDPTVIITSGAADVPLLRVCRVQTVTNNLWEGVTTPGMTFSYSTEATEASDNTPTLSQPTVRVHKVQGLLPYSIEVGQDYPGFTEEFSRVIDSAYNDQLATITMNGTGTNQPFGIFVALSNATSVITPTTDGSFGGTDIFKTWNALPERYRPNATWVMSVNVQSAIRQFAAASVANSAYFTINLSGSTFLINERPVIITDYAPTGVGGSVPGTTGLQNILAIADWQQTYLWVNRAGMSVEQIPLLFGGSNRFPTGQRGLYVWARNGGNSINSRGAIVLQNQ